VLLERLQADFAAALLDAGATSSLLPTLGLHGPDCAQRLGRYRGNVRAAWQKALAHAYPVVHALVGAEFFAALAEAYAGAHPSASGDLNEFGAQFCTFVRTYERAQSLPYLPDLAALEWLVHRAHYAADANVLARERMAVISPHDLLAARFSLHPACAWMQSRFPIETIWRAHQADSEVEWPDSLDRAESVLVTRPQWRVEAVESSAAEIAALAQLRAGCAMDDAIGAAFDADAKFDFAKTLVRWLYLGVLTDMR
jgi:hypothetical protein